MAEDMPVFPKAGSLLLRTGNVVNWDRLKRKLNQSATEELTDCISSTISGWLQKQDRNGLQYATSLEVANEKQVEKFSGEDRDEYKITAKISVSKFDADAVVDAVETLMAELGVSSIETVILSVPECKQMITELEPLWQALEELVEKEAVYSLGTADLDKEMLEQLYNWSKVKPCINQMNLASCCVILPEMAEFAKEHDIQLLTHNDPKEILPEKTFQESIASCTTEKDGANWEPSWVARYSVLIKCRGVIKAKGYTLKGVRDIKKRST